MLGETDCKEMVGRIGRSEDSVNPALVIPTFSRGASLKRLLSSLSAASYPNETVLVVSVDGGGSRSVVDVAEGFQWPHGEKVVLQQKRNYGPKEHLILCGDMVDEYGSVILLEDDLYVAPQFYNFAKAGLEYYSDDQEIAGIGLSSFPMHPWVWQPFLARPDPFDVFFVQGIAPWGQVWSKSKWLAFRSWLDKENDDRLNVQWLPAKLRTWGLNLDTLMYKYVVETDHYFVHPKSALLVNFCDAGAHFPHMNDFQAPLMLQEQEIKLCKLRDSQAVYDAWLEIRPWLLKDADAALDGVEFDVDLFGSKSPDQVSKPYMLTVKPAKAPIATFGLRLRPRELNVQLSVEGDEIVLARTENVAKRESKVRIGHREHYYYYSHLKVYQMLTAIFAKALTRTKRMIATRRFR